MVGHSSGFGKPVSETERTPELHLLKYVYKPVVVVGVERRELEEECKPEEKVCRRVSESLSSDCKI